jgi:hypothetical protein
MRTCMLCGCEIDDMSDMCPGCLSQDEARPSPAAATSDPSDRVKTITLPRTLIPLIEELEKQFEKFHHTCGLFNPGVSNLGLADLHSMKHAIESMIISTASRIVEASVKTTKPRNPSSQPRQPRKSRQPRPLSEILSPNS